MEIFNIKQLGWILIGIAIAFFLVLTFIVNEVLELQSLLAHANGCTLPDNLCPYKNNVPIPAVVGYIVDAMLAGIGAFLILNRKQSDAIRTESQERWKRLVKTLAGEEKKVYEIVGDSGGFIFQNELVDKSGMNKVKVTRILDKLEARGMVERKRRGMANVVTLRYS